MRVLGAFWQSGAAASPPTVSSIDPNIGDTAGGGGIVTVTGTNFTGATGVTLGGTAATSVTVVNATTITCIPGAHASGASQSVVVTTPAGSNGANTLFEYWTPAQITSIDAYCDANKGVTGGAAVSAWLDQSSNARNFVQSTAGNKPAQTASVFGTLPSIRFVAGRWVKLAAAVAQTGGSSMFFVGKWTSTDATEAQTGVNPPLTVVGDSAGGPDANIGASAGALCIGSQNGAVWALATRGSGLNDGTARLCGWTYSSATSDAKAYVGTVQQGTTYNHGGTYSQQFDTIGGGYLNDDGFVGDLGAVVIVAAVISAGDFTKLNSWARQRFGTP